VESNHKSSNIKQYYINMSNKLHPIYVALDAHQYSRAIKLALALPDSHVLGKALLAHAYSRSGQRYESLLVLQSILGIGNSFCELQHEIQYSLQARDETSATATIVTTTAAPDTASNKKGKKGKKGKPAPRPTPVAAATATPKQKHWDWIEQLDTPPTLPENWQELPSPETAITDEVSPCMFVCLDE
jgi:hypothetical protein